LEIWSPIKEGEKVYKCGDTLVILYTVVKYAVFKVYCVAAV